MHVVDVDVEHPPTGGYGHVHSAWGDRSIWNREYEQIDAIPSTLRNSPSRAFRRLGWSIGDLSGLTVLDAGAGAGRHAIYAASLGAKVHAVDSSDVACSLHSERALLSGVTSSVSIEHGRLGADDLPDGRYDVVLDSYVSCHILDAGDRLRFLDALMSCLAPGGKLYTAGIGECDTYYQRHLVNREPERIAVDPINGIAKLLQPRDIVTSDAACLGRLVASTTETFLDPVCGMAEWRQIHAAVLRR